MLGVWDRLFYFTFSFFTLCLLPGRIPGCCWSYLCSRSNYQHSQETEENSRSSFNCCRCNVYTVVGVHIKRLKTTFYSKFWFLTSFFQITSLQVNKREAVNWHVYVIQAVKKLGINKKSKVVFIQDDCTIYHTHILLSIF